VHISGRRVGLLGVVVVQGSAVTRVVSRARRRMGSCILEIRLDSDEMKLCTMLVRTR
jgi:hypothetical protein